MPFAKLTLINPSDSNTLSLDLIVKLALNFFNANQFSNSEMFLVGEEVELPRVHGLLK